MYHSPNPSPPQKSPTWFGKFQTYLREFVYGGVDGSVTTFAVVAGAYGANLDNSIILILGFANLIADGFSMSIGAYLSSKADLENYYKQQKIKGVEKVLSQKDERAILEEKYLKEGHNKETINQIVNAVLADRQIQSEKKHFEADLLDESKSPVKVGIATLISFNLIGFIPLMVFVFDWIYDTDIHLFFWSSIMTAVAFTFIGWLKSFINETNKFHSIFETLALGVIAATIAFFIGNTLESILF